MTRPESDHFNGKTFFLPGESDQRPGLWEVLKWRWTSKAVPWKPVAKIIPQPPPPKPASGLAVTWIGHASFLVQSPEVAFLFDPVFSDRASPFSRIGPRRAVSAGIDFAKLPELDAVFVSHDHYDHCDVACLRALARGVAPRLITPLGFGSLVDPLGFSEHIELDWWQTLGGDGWSVTFVPSRHWGRRWPGDTNTRLWGGFVLKAGGRMLYFLGDSGYHPTLFTQIRERGGTPDLALIPIGAYEPRWFMKDAHMNPEEAVQIHQQLAAKQSIGMHWGTFQLTDEDREDPVRALAQACLDHHLAPGEFSVLEVGATVYV